jgi:hypothetical protein
MRDILQNELATNFLRLGNRIAVGIGNGTFTLHTFDCRFITAVDRVPCTFPHRDLDKPFNLADFQENAAEAGCVTEWVMAGTGQKSDGVSVSALANLSIISFRPGTSIIAIDSASDTHCR